MKKIVALSGLLCILYFPVVISSTADTGSKEEVTLVSVTGKVIDHKSGEALAGVLVEFENCGVRIYTDFEGRFELNGVTPGRYSMSTSFISYESMMLDIELNGDNNEPVKIELNQISMIVP